LLSSCVTASTGQVSSQVLHRMQISGSMRCCFFGAAVAVAVLISLRDLHIFEVARLVVDADLGRRDPAANLPARSPAHQVAMKSPSSFDGSHWSLRFATRVVEQIARRRRLHVLELADLAVEGDMRQSKLCTDPDPFR
jgi:hypothetical protein